MKFSLNKDVLSKKIKHLKTSKALGKSGDIETSSMLIKAEEDKITFLLFNLAAWSSVIFFTNDKDVIVEESGEVFVDGQEFINVINTYPTGNKVNFYSEKNTTLEIFCSRGGKRSKKSSFPLRLPESFIEKPESEENEKTFKVNTIDFIEAVKSVEYVSAVDDGKKYLWGVQISFYDEGVVTFASDLHRMSYWDKAGLKDKVPLGIVVPQKLPLISILSSFDEEEPITISYGEKRTTLRQNNVWHTIPNVVFSSEKMPEWQNKVNFIENSKEWKKIKINKNDILSCIKTASSSLSGRFGIKVLISTSEKNITCSLEKINDEGYISSSFEETLPIEDDCIIDNIEDYVILTIEGIKESLTMIKSDFFYLYIKDKVNPIAVVGENDNFGFITVVIAPDSSDNDSEDEQ